MNKTKAQTIAKTLLKNKLNAKATVKELAPTNTDRGDDVKAVRWLQNAEVNKELMELLENAGITKDDIGTLVKELKDSKATATYKGKVTQSKKISNDNIRVKVMSILLDKLYNTQPQTQNIFIEKYQNMDVKELKQILVKQDKDIKELLSDN